VKRDEIMRTVAGALIIVGACILGYLWLFRRP
jgi:hypothetical protein